MLNRFNKSFFFSTLSVAFLLTLFSLIPPLSSLLVDFFNLLCPVGDFQISTLIAELTPVAVLLISAFVALVCALIGKLACRNKPAKPRKLGFYFFYLLAFTAVTLIISVVSVLTGNATEQAFSESDIITLPLVVGGCVLLSLALAAVMVSIISTLKTNITAAIIVMLVGLALLGTSLFAVLFIDKQSYYRDGEDYGYDEGYDEGEGDYDYEEPGYLSFLWDSPEYDVDSVRYAMAFMLDSNNTSWTENSPYYMIQGLDWASWALDKDTSPSIYDEDGLGDSHRAARKIYRHLLANPSDIRPAFDSYSTILYNEIMPYHTVNGGESGVKTIFDALLAAHEDLYTDSDLARLKKIKTLMNSVYHDGASEYYDDILMHINKDYLPRFIDSDGDECKALVVWAYSFWPRRHAQHNDEAVFNVLTEIVEFYNDPDNA